MHKPVALRLAYSSVITFLKTFLTSRIFARSLVRALALSWSASTIFPDYFCDQDRSRGCENRQVIVFNGYWVAFSGVHIHTWDYLLSLSCFCAKGVCNLSARVENLKNTTSVLSSFTKMCWYQTWEDLCLSWTRQATLDITSLMSATPVSSRLTLVSKSSLWTTL